MSTKIFNGYYLSLCTLQELHSFSMSLRSKIKTKMEELYAKKLLELSAYRYDRPSKNEKYCPLLETKFEIDGKFYDIERTNTRNPEYDFGFDVTFIPTETKILTLIYTEQLEYINIFNSFLDVHPYPYYNNIDKPSNISESEWESRSLEWDNALNPYDIPSLQGFSIKCVVYLPLFNKDELLRYSHLIPTFEERLQKIVLDESWYLFTKRYKNHYNISPKIRNYLDWKNTKSGKDKLSQLKDKISKQLNLVVTIDDLLEDPK